MTYNIIDYFQTTLLTHGKYLYNNSYLIAEMGLLGELGGLVEEFKTDRVYKNLSNPVLVKTSLLLIWKLHLIGNIKFPFLSNHKSKDL